MSAKEDNKRTIEQERRAEIVTAAKKLFYTNGYGAASVEQIAKEAGISKGLIYHYFRSKKELLLSFSDELENYLDELKHMDDPLAALRRFGTDFLVHDGSRFADAPPTQILLTSFADQVFDISGHEGMNPILKDYGRDYLGTFFQEGINRGIFRDGDAKEYGDIYWSFLLGKLLTVKKGYESQPSEVYVDEILSVFRNHG